jgi:hypothetical protein
MLCDLRGIRVFFLDAVSTGESTSGMIGQRTLLSETLESVEEFLSREFLDRFPCRDGLKTFEANGIVSTIIVFAIRKLRERDDLSRCHGEYPRSRIVL